MAFRILPSGAPSRGQNDSPDDKELRRYFQHVDNVWGLSKDVSYNTQVIEARWANGLWSVKTADGRSYRCKWVLTATGTSFKPHSPIWKGADLFKGEMHHSARWPENLDLVDKRVAVIGAGSSGVQIMQEAGKVASHVTHYIRTPNMAVPMRQRYVSKDEIDHHKTEIPHVFKACRTTRSGLPVLNTGRATFDDSPEERESVFREQWHRGGFNW